jgi:hypothetical protein
VRTLDSPGVVSSLQTIDRCAITVVSVSCIWNKVKEAALPPLGLKPCGFRAGFL